MSQGSGSQQGEVSPSEKFLAMSEDILDFHDCCGWRGATSILWVQTKDAAKHPAVYKTAPTVKN